MSRIIRLLGFVVFICILMAWLAIKLVPIASDENITLTPIQYADIEGWGDDTQGNALLAFRNSCGFFLDQPAGTENTPVSIGGTSEQWVEVCEKANQTLAENQAQARHFFEENFTPFSLSYHGESRGLLTGYYEPLIEGSWVQDETHSIPLYIRPPELITVNLGLFRDDLKGRRVAGRVVAGQLEPFEARDEIEDGALNGRNLELLWLKDPVDAFFLQIQGSGRVILPDGKTQKVGYAGPNGHPYTSIGAKLVEMGFFERKDLSMQSIKAWLEQNPIKGKALMRENASYIFFRLLEGDSPVGAQGVELTPGRSLAVDRTQIPMGAPIWLNATRPAVDDPLGEPTPFRRLLVAQDTGGAIRGGLRGDVFWGVGHDAEIIAGHMANWSGFIILLPNNIAQSLNQEG